MPVIFENRPILAPHPVTPSSEFVLNTKFDGLSWVEVVDFGDDKDYRLDGTDASTGQVFSASQPQIWNSYWGDASLTNQLITGVGRYPGVTPDMLFTLDFATVDGLKCASIAREYDPYVGVDQASMRLKTAASFANQSMVVQRGKIKIPSGLDNATGNGLLLTEVKFNYSDKKLQIDIWHESGQWYFRCSAVRAGSGYRVWNNTSPGSPDTNSSPTQDSFFANDHSANYFRSIPDPRGKWVTFMMGYRLKDASSNVAGGGSQGWFYAASGIGTTTVPVDFSACTQEFYIEGINMADDAAPGATILFPLAHYTDFNCAGLPFYWTDVQIATQWPSDSPSGIPSGAV